MNFDKQIFANKCETLVKFFANITRTPINAERWEEIIYTALKSMNLNEEIGWDVGSHSPGMDISVGGEGISAKSGQLTSTSIKISSHRLTRFETLEEMIEFIDDKNYTKYYCLARKTLSKTTTYTIYEIDADVVDASSATWGNVPSGCDGVQANGVKLKIVNKMSNQLWLEIPLSLTTKLKTIQFKNEDTLIVKLKNR